MRKLIVFLFLVAVFCTRGEAAVRKPAVSGGFYPASPNKLREQVDKFMDEAENIEVPGKIIALVVPHAGYMYSGRTAGYAYKKIRGENFDTVILIGTSHRERFSEVAVADYDFLQTPLGKIEVDRDMVGALLKSSAQIRAYNNPHVYEHSLEVQLPFLQEALGEFKIVAILMGEESIKTSSALGEAIAENARGKSVLIIASTDLSHYHPYGVAQKLDEDTIKEILNLDAQSLLIETATGKCEACGAGATAAAIIAAKKFGADSAKLLKYENSGDVTGDKAGVVGYAAIAIYKKNNPHAFDEFAPLNKEEQKKLLRIARESIEEYVTTGRISDFRVDDPVLNEKRGVFVTIYENGDLRGCIGTHTSDEPLYKTVSEMAISAACRDPRFPPLRESELNRINIKVSVYLMSPTKVESVEQIKLGEHGIIFKKGFWQSTFLPEVAIEQGWDKETTLEYLSTKAGLSPDAWKRGAEFFVYKTQVFGE